MILCLDSWRYFYIDLSYVVPAIQHPTFDGKVNSGLIDAIIENANLQVVWALGCIGWNTHGAVIHVVSGQPRSNVGIGNKDDIPIGLFEAKR
jgi:hypothetical protein